MDDKIIIIRHYLKGDQHFPNNEELPLLIYKNTLLLEKTDDENAKTIERLFRKNDWKNSWRNSIFDYHHYHSNAHEVLGVYSGKAKVQFGGPMGIVAEIMKGDVVVIPAGVAHKSLQASPDFKCVGAYPHNQEYDMKYGEENEREDAERNIKLTPFPDYDPVFGKRGPLDKWWNHQFVHNHAQHA